MPDRVMYVVRSWPRLSQTFIVGEILALERWGVELDLVALTASGEQTVQPAVADVRAPVTVLDDRRRVARLRSHLRVAAQTPLRYLSVAALTALRPELSQGYASATAAECFDAAVQVTDRIRGLRREGVTITHLHAHFAHDPALVTLFAARLTGLAFTVTAHARDLYQLPVRSLEFRVRAAAAVLTCCRANLDYLRDTLSPRSVLKARVLHHGVDLRTFTPTAGRPAGRLQVVSIGRLVDKKGFPDLLRACALVAAGDAPDFRLTIYGDGPLRPELHALRDALGLSDTVTFAGEADSSAVLAALRGADLFALTPFVTADGDRDGVPNVIVEALACGLPVLTTAAGGVAEAVQHDQNGLVVVPRDVPAIAAALRRLLTEPALRRRLAPAARARAEASFDVDRAARELAAEFAEAAA